jgi:hypothetical protein
MTNNKINKLKNIIQLYTNTENMTNNKLAVEWLAKSYVDLLTKLNNEEISLKEFEIQYIEILEQAKEMENKRMMQCYSDGLGNGIAVGREECSFESVADEKEYLIKTYGGSK